MNALDELEPEERTALEADLAKLRGVWEAVTDASPNYHCTFPHCDGLAAFVNGAEGACKDHRVEMRVVLS